MQIGNDKTAHDRLIQICLENKRTVADAFGQVGFEQNLCRRAVAMRDTSPQQTTRNRLTLSAKAKDADRVVTFAAAKLPH